MSSSIKTILIVLLFLIGAVLFIRKSGIFAAQKDRIEKELTKPVPLGEKWTVAPVWNEREWTDDQCNAIAVDTTHRFFAIIQSKDRRGADIMKTIVRYQDIRQVDLEVDNLVIATVSRPRLATQAIEELKSKRAMNKVQKNMPVIQPVGDEESIRDIRLMVYTMDGRTVPLSFGLSQLDRAKKWYRQFWHAVSD